MEVKEKGGMGWVRDYLWLKRPDALKHRDGISLREEAVLVDALKNWPPKA
jgi:hypothetical protein